ncbi:MAG: hypothetical protein KKF30_09830 [Proteobacteria bacterium]|nr:hypothetical protein [Pseudomonadota bacterium]MBU4468841.1 hypothetical protein [Pseudomonadota bacterium]MCG2750834.1 hypothetical protein [Desulfobacteraceae bacterium]
MNSAKKHFMPIVLASLFVIFNLSPAFAQDPTNMAEAMKASGFDFETARWISKTTQEDGNGKIQKSTQKFWISGNQVRMEIQDEATGETQIIIDDGTHQYLYDPAKKTAMVMNAMMKNMSSGLLSSDSFKQAAENRKAAKTVGTETINGKACTIKEYASTLANITSNVREWVWNEKQFPMKSIVTIPGQTTTMMGQSIKMPGSKTESVVTEVTLNQSIDGSLFKLPAGVKTETMGNPFDPSETGNDEESQDEK